MISYNRSTSRGKLVAVALTLSALAVASLWWFTRDTTAQPEAAPVAEVASSPDAALGQQRQMAAEALLHSPQVLDDGRPADFQPDEWQSLKDAIAKNPNAAAELKRITAYMRFQRGFEHWQSLMDTPDVKARNELGQKLVAVLPERLTNQEVTFDEALMICAALINDMDPSEQARQQQLEQCNVRLQQAAPRIDDDDLARQNSCEVQWSRERSRITAEHLSKREDQRDQRAFEAEMERARVAIFDSPECKGKN